MADQQEGRDLERERAQRREQHQAQTWAEFVKDVCSRAAVDRHLAECAAVSVLLRLEQRITHGEANALDAQLPMKLRELMAKGKSSETKLRPRDIGRKEFVELVAEDLQKDETQALQLVRAVFGTARAHITEGEAEKVSANLPTDLRHLWARES